MEIIDADQFLRPDGRQKGNAWHRAHGWRMGLTGQDSAGFGSATEGKALNLLRPAAGRTPSNHHQKGCRRQNPQSEALGNSAQQMREAQAGEGKKAKKRAVLIAGTDGGLEARVVATNPEENGIAEVESQQEHQQPPLAALAVPQAPGDERQFGRAEQPSRAQSKRVELEQAMEGIEAKIPKAVDRHVLRVAAQMLLVAAGKEHNQRGSNQGRRQIKRSVEAAPGKRTSARCGPEARQCQHRAGEHSTRKAKGAGGGEGDKRTRCAPGKCPALWQPALLHFERDQQEGRGQDSGPLYGPPESFDVSAG